MSQVKICRNSKLSVKLERLIILIDVVGFVKAGKRMIGKSFHISAFGTSFRVLFGRKPLSH